MDTNRFAPPKAAVQDIASQSGTAPALWNPNAAANWSLLFTPVFGAYLHMKNWQALGDQDKAASAKAWAIGSAVFLILMAGLSLAFIQSKAMDGLSRSVGLGLLMAWYFGNARAQAKFVKAQFAATYPRKGWTKPLLIALVCYSFFVLIVGSLAIGRLGDNI